MPFHGHPRPYPLQPLLDVTRVTPGQLGHLVNANGSAVRKAAAVGLTESEADRWAVRLGRHPVEIWGDLWLNSADRPALTLFDPDDEMVAA